MAAVGSKTTNFPLSVQRTPISLEKEALNRGSLLLPARVILDREIELIVKVKKLFRSMRSISVALTIIS